MVIQICANSISDDERKNVLNSFIDLCRQQYLEVNKASKFSKAMLKQDEHWNESLVTRDSNPERKEMGVKSSPQYGWAAK